MDKVINDGKTINQRALEEGFERAVQALMESQGISREAALRMLTPKKRPDYDSSRVNL